MAYNISAVINEGFMKKTKKKHSIFDTSFSEFVTPRIISIIFSIEIFLSALVAVAAVILGIIYVNQYTSIDSVLLLFLLLLSPLLILALYYLLVLISRISCEIILVLFRIAENTTPPAQTKDETYK